MNNADIAAILLKKTLILCHKHRIWKLIKDRTSVYFLNKTGVYFSNIKVSDKPRTFDYSPLCVIGAYFLGSFIIKLQQNIRALWWACRSSFFGEDHKLHFHTVNSLFKGYIILTLSIFYCNNVTTTLIRIYCQNWNWYFLNY